MQSTSEGENSVDEKLEQLQAKEAASPHKSSTLPPELLSLIFERICPESNDEEIRPLNETHILLSLGAVCSQWRRVAWSTPSLWTSITLFTSHRTTPICDEILRLHFRNCTTLRLSLILSSLPSFSDGLHALEVLKTVFVENAERIGMLKYDTPPIRWWSTLFPLIKAANFSNLVSLHLSSGMMPRLPYGILITHCPRLRHVSLAGSRVTYPRLPWLQITKLRLANLSFWQCIQILSQCLQLVECHLKDLRLMESPFLQEVIVLKNLEVFEWRNSTYPIENDTLQTYFRFPSLRRLVWDVPLPQDNSSFNVWKQFFSHMTNLIVFECHILKWPDVAEILDVLPSIRTLHMTTIDSAPTYQLLHFLTVTQQQPIKLSNLHLLKLTGCYTRSNRLTEAATRMLESRWDDPGKMSEDLLLSAPGKRLTLVIESIDLVSGRANEIWTLSGESRWEALECIT